MSIFTTSVLTVVGVLVAAYAVGQFTSKSFETEIEIEAPPAAVWAVLSDTEGHADWNPFIRSFTGDLVVGNTLAVTMQLGERSPQTFTPTVLVASENHELRWIGQVGARGIFDGEHYFIMEETARGTTLFRHGETFTGMLVYPLMLFIGADAESGFKAMNAALKERTEAAS